MRSIPLSMYTDSRSLLDVITKNSSMSEGRLLIDVAAARQAYARFHLSYICLLSSEHISADAFAKVKACPPLKILLRDGIRDHR